MRTTWQRSELLFCFFLLVVLAGALWVSLGWSQRAGLFPWIALVPTLALTIWQLVDDARGKTTPPTTVVGDEGDETELEAELPPGVMARRGAQTVGWIGAFFLAMVLLGFAIGGGLLSALYVRFAAHERWRVSIVYGVVAYLLLEVLFHRLLSIPLPDGLVLDWLGIDL